MKLQSMNGNLISLAVKEPSIDNEEEKAEPLEGASVSASVSASGSASASASVSVCVVKGDEEEGVGEEQSEEVEKDSGGKKKGTRKKRSLNWEEAERAHLLEVIKPKVEFVENRNVDAKSIKAKRLAWVQITKQFNAFNFRHRSLEQIQVQWRSMKNSAKREYQQKHSKAIPIDGISLIEFIEELQKEPTATRSQTRGGSCAVVKKEIQDLDDDTPLAALPSSSNTSENTLQTSTIALPSPPPSGESQNEIQRETSPSQNKKKMNSTLAKSLSPKSPGVGRAGIKSKRQRSLNLVQSNETESPASTELQTQDATVAATGGSSALFFRTDEKYKKQIFELMKRARVAEMDYARREHEQKLRFEQMEQELKLEQLREEHATRMRHCQMEHEARMRAYILHANVKRINSKNDNNEQKDIK